jgi:hypothetical protein
MTVPAIKSCELMNTDKESFLYPIARHTYSKSLDSMKNAHLNAFFHMQEVAMETQLTPSFAHFNPCPLKLTIVELCKKPFNFREIPEIFLELENDFRVLHQQYQNLHPTLKKQLFDEMVEGDLSEGIEFNKILDEFVAKVANGPNSSELSSVIDVFHQEVYDAKELIDCLIWAIRRENKMSTRQLSTDTLMMHTLSSFVRTGEFAGKQPRILSAFLPRLEMLKAKYKTLSASSKSFLNQEFQIGRCGMKHEKKAQEILNELEKIILEIKSNNRSLAPLLVFLAYKQVHGSC